MDTKWLEDFLTLAETRSFSKAAQLRNVTQPAFSRRIQALEAWAGTDLFDRSAFPTRLTPAGETLRGQASDVLQGLASVRATLRERYSAGNEFIEFAVPHTLAFTYFPAWIAALHAAFRPVKSRLTALNVHDAALRLLDGGCDMLIAYHHPDQPLRLDPERFAMVVLGQETLAPYARADHDGRPAFCLPGTVRTPVPYLAYGPGAYLGALAARLIQSAAAPLHLRKVYETDIAESLKAMVLQGHGLAFLPEAPSPRRHRAAASCAPMEKAKACRSPWKSAPTRRMQATAAARPKQCSRSFGPFWRRGRPEPLHRAARVEIERVKRGLSANVEAVALWRAETDIGDDLADRNFADQRAVGGVAIDAAPG